MKQALTIAGSDSGGGAGIQADIKTFHAHGVFGMSVLTAVTAQNTRGVTRAFDLPIDLIRAQLDAVFDDFEVSAAKTGMLSSKEIIAATAAMLLERRFKPLVVDPVMISKSGYKLLADDALEGLKSQLLPIAHVVTPNIHEAELLAGMVIDSLDGMKEAARRISTYGCRNVIVKGGHSRFNPGTDVLYDGAEFHEFSGKYHDKGGVHGTGCTFSAAIVARLALGETLVNAVEHAKEYTTRAIELAPQVGRGHHPAHHFYFLDPDDCLKR